MAERTASLVTGGAGFIGAHLAQALVARGEGPVVVLDDLSGGFERNVPAGATFVRGSVTDAALMRSLFAEHQFRHVYHLAAYAAEGLSHFIRRFNYANNVIGSVTVLNECIRTEVECVVFTSSIAVYGPVTPPMRESQHPAPEDPYGIAKYAVELDLAAAHHQFGLKSVIFRPHNVYGEFQHIGDRFRNVIGIFMNQILRGEPLTIFGDGQQQRAFSYVGDIIPAMAAAPTTPTAAQEIFNVGADQPTTVAALADAVCEAMGAPGHPRVHLPPRIEVVDAWADHSKAARMFGEPPKTALRDGLARMAAWAKSLGPQGALPVAEVEVERGLPPSWRSR
jgi:UDP-glucose 4-epimerase